MSRTLRKFCDVLKVALVSMIALTMVTFNVAAQAQVAQVQNGLSLLQVLPAVTFFLAVITGALNLYIMNKLGKQKDEILTLIRAEVKSEVDELHNKMASKEQVEFLGREMKLLLGNIELKIERSNK